MEHIEIRRPNYEDIQELDHFFEIMITDTFNKEGIGHLVNEMQEEIETKKQFIEQDLDSGGEYRYFLIALERDQIIGSIAIGPANELICTCTGNAFKDLTEIGTVFVHPEYQQKGIGNLLLNAIYRAMENKAIEEFCLDSGYKTAQKIWQKKYGSPAYLLNDFWGAGSDHMIWKVQLSKVAISV
ncbi:GNAT family N-acetyltransferase [Paenisporosarcina sp.]|uniref:GNAT family N-acetyltransferase n=1 Tax=Paenisporosarcina sp. TaxID=1932001 RepID=UPI003C70BC91